MADFNPFLLAANTPDPDPRLLPLLREKPQLASAQDSHGYSLLHAAASYNHVELLRTLIHEFKVDVNLRDEDDETCLFVAESVEVAKCLVEDLHIDAEAKNSEGQTAREKFEGEADFPDVTEYLAEKEGREVNGTSRPPPLPPNVRVNIGETMDVGGQEPDPEFRRRIEELAVSDSFHTEEGQRELKDLITDAVRDVSSDGPDSQRRRVG